MRSCSIWLFDLSRENASAQLHGFDISLAQCPPPEWLPSNVSIRKLDIYESLPEELVGQYDVVHVRLFLCVIKNNDPVPVLTNLLKMLSEFQTCLHLGVCLWGQRSGNSVRVFNIKVC